MMRFHRLKSLAFLVIFILILSGLMAFLPEKIIADVNYVKVTFTARTSRYNTNVRSGPGLSYKIIGKIKPNTKLTFDGYIYGDKVTDLWLGTPDYRWYKIKGKDMWVASAVVIGNAPGSKPLPPNAKKKPSKPSTEEKPHHGSSSIKPNLNSAAYKGGVNPFPNGECTWFAWGRALEKTNTKISFTQNYGRHGGRWWYLVSKKYKRGREPRTNSIAVWSGGSYGHVAFVEKVEGNSVIIGEANWNPAGCYNGNRTFTKSSIRRRGSYRLLGFIYL